MKTKFLFAVTIVFVTIMMLSSSYLRVKAPSLNHILNRTATVNHQQN